MRGWASPGTGEKYQPHGLRVTSPVATFVAMLSRGRMVLSFIWLHPANRGRRGRALARAMRFHVRARLRRRRMITLLGERSRVWAEKGYPSSTRAVYANPPDLPEMLVWRHAGLEGGTFIDVGANIGLYSLYAAECGARVVALEPGRAAFERLGENIRLNGYEVRALRAAAAERAGQIRVTMDLDTVNHIAENGELVEAVTIDGLLSGAEAAGIKVDVEGFERLVLEGARESLRAKRIKLLQLEWNATSYAALGEDRRPVADLLLRLGYELLRPDSSGALRRVAMPEIGADVFARPV